MVRGGDHAIRVAAAQALSRTEPEPGIAVRAFGTLLESRDAASRDAGVAGLAGLVTAITRSGRRTDGTPREFSRSEVIEVARAVVSMASGGLGDPQPGVRRRSVEALYQTAWVVEKLVSDPHPGTVEQTADAEIDRREAEQEEAELEPLALDLRDLTPGLTQTLQDPDREIRLLAHETLEHLGVARRRLEARRPIKRETPPGLRERLADAGNEESSLPIARTPSAERPLLERLRAALPELEIALSDVAVQVRRSAVDTVEAMGKEATPAAPALVRALADPDRFVRWAAARSLGRMGPVTGTDAVAKLSGLLSDPALDVRLGAAEALRCFGSAARDAVPDLVRAAGSGDAEMRLAALHALEAIGPSDRDGVLALANGLEATDARIRKATAHLFSRFGRAAVSARQALRSALNDNDPDVRRAASDALLDISRPPDLGNAVTLRPPSSAMPAVARVAASLPPVTLRPPIAVPPPSEFAQAR
jgi:HEAT repeat protein